MAYEKLTLHEKRLKALEKARKVRAANAKKKQKTTAKKPAKKVTKPAAKKPTKKVSNLKPKKASPTTRKTNPSKRGMKTLYLVAMKHAKTGKKYFYTGATFDDERRKATFLATEQAAKDVANQWKNKVPTGYALIAETVTIKK